jgi:hypothetical protein
VLKARTLVILVIAALLGFAAAIAVYDHTDIRRIHNRVQESDDSDPGLVP